MDVRIIRYTDNMVDAIASSYAITRGLAYGEFQAKYYTLEKKRELITDCFESGHMSGFEFADIDFEILGCSRVFEVDKVRSRIASYEVEAGLFSEQRNFESVIPSDYDAETAEKRINIIRQWNEEDKARGIDPRIRRYWTNQGLSRRMRFKTNLRAFIETAWNRCCVQTQWEYREFMNLAKQRLAEIDPFISSFINPKCVHLGYCNEKWKPCGAYPKKEDVLKAVGVSHD